MDDNPFPFCTLCATWHVKDEHVHPMWASHYRKPWLTPERFNAFGVGFACGALLATAAFLVAV